MSVFGCEAFVDKVSGVVQHDVHALALQVLAFRAFELESWAKWRSTQALEDVVEVSHHVGVFTIAEVSLPSFARSLARRRRDPRGILFAGCVTALSRLGPRVRGSVSRACLS